MSAVSYALAALSQAQRFQHLASQLFHLEHVPRELLVVARLAAFS